MKLSEYFWPSCRAQPSVHSAPFSAKFSHHVSQSSDLATRSISLRGFATPFPQGGGTIREGLVRFKIIIYLKAFVFCFFTLLVLVKNKLKDDIYVAMHSNFSLNIVFVHCVLQEVFPRLWYIFSDIKKDNLVTQAERGSGCKVTSSPSTAGRSMVTPVHFPKPLATQINNSLK